MKRVTLDSLEKYLGFFHTMYDVVRLVDPVEKCVLESRQNRLSAADDVCHAYWGDGGICENCISVRAHQGAKCFMKLERSDEAVMLVTAMPVEQSDRPVVIELLRNATDTMLVGSGIYGEGLLMQEQIREINRSIVSDDLTGVYNRRFVDERLPADIVRMLLEKKPLSVIFLDIDNLKAVNDTFGHPRGDQMIRAVADAVSKNIRDGVDWVARLGGDEFLICLPDTPARGAHRVAERIREAIRPLSACPEGRIAASVSMGIYTSTDQLLNANELIRLADERMYRAKQLGKDRVCADEGEP